MFDKIFKHVDPDTLNDNFFKVIHREWMLITAGTISHFNTMTASWGATGILWNKRIAICFVRPTRYTFEFAEKSSIYTLSFFNSEFQDILNYCGCHSGRKEDKIAETGLKPLEMPAGGITYSQSRMVLECRTVYSDYIKEENFIDMGMINLHYPRKDFHKLYIGEIVGCYIRL
jgi:flavin reductase (DIM6/NTAB) family NADH-FMN oxidoreductase RutF